MQKKGRVVFVGSIFRDLVTVSERFPKRGETVFGSEYLTGFGGKGANPCVMAARLGATVSLVGKVGKDENGSAYLAHLAQENIDISHVGVEEGISTGIATILVESSTGENQIVIVPGANQLLQPQHVQAAAQLIQGCSVLSTVLEIQPEVVLAALKLGKEKGLTTVLNAAPARADLEPEILENTDILIVNQTEAEIISGLQGDWKVTTSKLKELGCKNIIVTLGSEGAVLIQENTDAVHIPGTKVEKVVDTTGAGDAFVGSLTYFLSTSTQITLHQAAERACRLASYTVGAQGTQTSYPHRDQVLDLL